MGTDDKIRNVADQVEGKAKEVAGRVKDDDDLEMEGKVERKKADAAQATEKIKDAFK